MVLCLVMIPTAQFPNIGVRTCSMLYTEHCLTHLNYYLAIIFTVCEIYKIPINDFLCFVVSTRIFKMLICWSGNLAIRSKSVVDQECLRLTRLTVQSNPIIPPLISPIYWKWNLQCEPTLPIFEYRIYLCAVEDLFFPKLGLKSRGSTYTRGELWFAANWQLQ